ncbi:hypothetical protein [Kineococcus sp. SYSU DK005]|uniref:hypothetical protein n=1 Tax=Kineococcus sp. SYSU DK005 TaxID=3383126 RepID=UPI003D7E8D1B
MVRDDRPAAEVHNFLGRPGPRRSTRTLADHLSPRPARPVPPAAPAAPAAGARPAPAPAPRPAARPSPAPGPAPAPRPETRPAPPAAPPTRAAAAPPAPPAPPAPVAAVGLARRSEELLVLDDERPVARVPAAERGSGTLRVLLQWEPRVTASGVRRSTDLHLGCLWQTRERRDGLVQSLGDLLAAPGYGARQVLRMGARTEDGEELLVDTRHLDLLRRLVLYVYAVRPEPPDYAALAPRLTLRRRDGSRLQARATGAPAGARTCALVSIHDVGGDLVVRRENEFFIGPQREVAEAYGFDDIAWTPDGTLPRTT